MSHKKARIPHTFIQTRINNGIQNALEKTSKAAYQQGLNAARSDAATDKMEYSIKIQKLRQDNENLNSHVDALNADLTEAERKLQQKEAHHKYQLDKMESTIQHLEERLAAREQLPVPFVNNGFFIHNWRDGGKWLSNMFFSLIAFFAVTPIPSELLAVLPEGFRTYLIAFCAFCGLFSRFINQSKGVQQWLSKS